MVTKRAARDRSIGLATLFTLLLALPFASPFASAGPQPHSTSPTIAQQQNKAYTGDGAQIRRPMAPGNVESLPGPKKRSGLGRVFSIFSSAEDQNSPIPPVSRVGEQDASLVSRLLFGYTSPLLKKAADGQLDADDAFELCEDRKMGPVVNSLERMYDLVKFTSGRRLRDKGEKDETSIDAKASMLTRSLFLHQRRMLLYTGILRLINTSVQAFPAILVARLLRLVEAGQAYPARKALTTAVALIAVLSAKMVIENQYFHNVIKCSTQVRGALAGLIFDKSLRLPSGGGDGIEASSSSQNDTNNATAVAGKTPSLGAGGVLNLMQSDASIIEFATLQIHTIWDGPLQIALYTSLLYKYLGPSVFYGIAVLLVTIPVNSFSLRILNRLAKYENEAKDARTKRTAESISNMKLLKLQGWEGRFADDIRGHRREELRRHVSRGVVRALNTAVTNAVPSIVLVVTLMAYIRTGKPIVASTIFTAISLFNQLRFPLFFYPMLIDSLANGRNAMRRISTYLGSEEIVPYVRNLPALVKADGSTGGCIEMHNGNFLWPSSGGSSATNTDGEEQASPALANVELKVNPGEVVAVVGSVGSGKTALIKGLLGELNPVPSMVVKQEFTDEKGDSDARIDASASDDTMKFEKPFVSSYGNVAYCSQEAWLPKGTIRDAIVFGRDYDEKRYLAAIYDAGLDKDIVDSLHGADSQKAASSGVLSHDTNVGEGGSALSGGQRARVALARALYSGEDTKVFLLDDCLAALDASVGSTVFERVSKRLRGSNAAAILVTNDPSLPRQCDRVILMGNVPNSVSCSTVLDTGSYDELIARGHDLRSISSIDVEDDEDIDEDVEELFYDIDHSADHKNYRSRQSATTNRHKTLSAFKAKPVGNDTDIACHADPECQVVMENCPDYIAEKEEFFGHNSKEKPKITVDLFRMNDTSPSLVKKSTPADTETIDDIASEAPDTKVISADDSMSDGAVPPSVYLSYLKSVRKPSLVVAMAAAYLMANGAQFFQQWTVAKWTEVGAEGMASALNLKYMSSLVKAAWVVSGFLWIRSFLTMKVGVRASEHMHSKMLTSVFSAPMSFFDATPSGQLLSRFGKEIETVDRGVPDSIGSVLFCFLQIFMSVGALAGVITPAMLIPLMGTGYFYVKAMSLFRPAARHLKRAETKTRSPIYTQFGEALRGTETIRSITGAKKWWSDEHRALTDKNLGVFSTVKVLDRWLSTRLETLGNAVVLTAAFASVFLTRAGRLQAGSAGWGLTQALAITGLMTWAVRTLTDLETNMMSVMRVKELSNLDSELTNKAMPKELSQPGEALTPLLHPDTDTHKALAPIDSNALVQSGWPWRGSIKFSNVSMRYNKASKLVLNGVDLSVPAGTTLGVVGRTGSGKSSLLLTLFRLVEIEKEGSIEIDGVDIRSVGLEQLRQSLAIIPQDPVLFAGSVAYNLDATGRSSPEDMWSALEAASPKLAEQFRQDDGLNSEVSEGGKNLSLGQRQLICLARALLRNSRILVLDEATSSVDAKTDQEVQDTIRREFVNRGVSVITVAHRLDTVMGYDKIAVLGDGRVLEYGAPNDLLKIPKGELRRLVEADRNNKRKGAKRSKEAALAL